MVTSTSLAHARQLDTQDPLNAFRARFYFPNESLIYLDGNSLGRLPLASQQRAQQLIQHEWGERLIRSWGEGWMELPVKVGGKLSGLIGAQAHEVLIAESTSVNLYKLAMAALRHQTGRKKILTDNMNFPSDLYILQGIVETLDDGHTIEVIPSPDDVHGPTQAILDCIDENTALVTLSHTVFKSGFVYDMAKITAAAHAKGALVLWDLSHSVGSVLVELNGAGADLAIGCTYKYLNGGPGAPAFLYIREDLQVLLDNPISGWWGQKNMFGLALEYDAEQDLRRFQTGTASILQVALIEIGIDLLLEAGMNKVREKSALQTDYLLQLWQQNLAPLGYRLNSPIDAAQRGSHISLGHDEGLRINKALIDRYQIIPDFRAPDNIRLGIAPLYTRYEDIYRCMQAMRETVETKSYEKYTKVVPLVT